MNPLIRYSSQALYEKGIRPQNEDALAPNPREVDEETNVYVVCDGVGGGSKGEVASQICAKTMADFLGGLDENDFNPALYEEGLRDSEALIERYIAKNPGNESMSTTLTWIRFTKNGEAHLGWVGDSRVYQFRNGKIIYQTSDHSLVNAMVKAGDLTQEEARSHPQKNVILRAVSGVGEPVEMDAHRITDLKSGDRFLLCTDGVTDALSPSDLEMFLDNKNDLAEATQRITEECALNSKDNYSAYLIQLEMETQAGPSETINEKAERLAEKTETPAAHKNPTKTASPKTAPEQSQGFRYGMSLVIGVLALSLIGSFFAYRYFEQQKFDAIYESRLGDAEVFYHQGAYEDAIERFEEAERMKTLDPVMKNMLDSARIKRLLPVYSDLVVSDLKMVITKPHAAVARGLDFNADDGFAFQCAQPERISGLHYFVKDSLLCKSIKRQVHFNMEKERPLEIDSTQVIFWTEIPDQLKPHFVELIVLDDRGMEVKAVQYGDELHYNDACADQVKQ